MAMEGGKAPLSLAVLIASEKWGCPPWEIAGGSKMDWFSKWQFLEEQRAKRQDYG